MRARRLAARWLLPVAVPPIEHGAVLIGADGRIQAVGSDTDVPRPAGVPAEEYESAVILPGLINTHTHLELTGFDQVGTEDFPGWIRRLRELKATRTPAEYLVAARHGVADCFNAGVTTIADTGDSGVVIRALAEMGGSGVAYQEVFGPEPVQCDTSLAGLQQRITELRQWATGRVRIGVSPHAPYTVSSALLQTVVRWSKREQLPLAVHISESREEVELVARGSGPFAEAWRARGIPVPESSGSSPLDWLARHGALTERTLCIHAVQVGPPDIVHLVRAGAAVAHCPLSNQAHGHGAAPLGQLLEAGVAVGLGTDSVVSVGRLDLLAEARAARDLAGLSADETVALCTLGGAKALGLEAETGSLEAGKWGDCVVIRVVDRPGRNLPAEWVLASSPGDVMLTCVAGRTVYRAQ
jgi:cytosine/adenosine deaminase-related metal-dependent hydrolase